MRQTLSLLKGICLIPFLHRGCDLLSQKKGSLCVLIGKEFIHFELLAHLIKYQCGFLRWAVSYRQVRRIKQVDPPQCLNNPIIWIFVLLTNAAMKLSSIHEIKSIIGVGLFPSV